MICNIATIQIVKLILSDMMILTAFTILWLFSWKFIYFEIHCIIVLSLIKCSRADNIKQVLDENVKNTILKKK